MARTKQVAPVRREVSSEYVNGLQTWEKSGPSKERHENALLGDAGVVQLAIAVGGIYASL
jgi:hypothetical protein